MTTTSSAVVAPQVAVQPGQLPWGFAEYFVISQTALPALLFLPGSQAFRLPIRVAPFAISLVAFAWWQIEGTRTVRASRAQAWIGAVMVLLAAGLVHPSTPSIVGGLAHMGVYFAVMAPLFWAPPLVRSPERLARLLWILLLCCGANAVVGVLQIYDPDRWLPAEFSRVLTSGGGAGLGPVTFTGPNGVRMVRPPGLFDTPGAVAGPAMAAALLGLVFAISAIPMWRRAMSLVLAGAGLAAIYLSQVRISLAMAILMLAAYFGVLSRQGRVAKASTFALLAGGVVVGGFVLAVALGGTSISDRVMTLFAADPLTVYRTARGTQLDLTFGNLLVEHPLGAGLGRWGMAAGYFGSFSDVSGSLWAEIQLTGWMIDGGILMIVLYVGSLIVTTLSQWQVAMHDRYPRVATCGAVVFSLNIGTAALIFSFTPFVSQIGIQYWFLAGALHGVATSYGVDGA